MNVPDPPGQKKRTPITVRTPAGRIFLFCTPSRKKTGPLFQDMNMYTRFPPKRTDQKKIFTRIVSRSSFSPV